MVNLLGKQERGTTCKDNVIRNGGREMGRGRVEGLRPEDESALSSRTVYVTNQKVRFHSKRWKSFMVCMTAP